MKNTLLTFILFLLGLFFHPNFSFGQLYEVSLDEKIQKLTLIVEGKLVESRCYRADHIKFGQDIVFYSAIDTSFKCSSPMASVLGIDCATLPIEDIDSKIIQIKAIPNPVSDFVNILLPKEVFGKQVNIKIVDHMGRMNGSLSIYTSRRHDLCMIE